MHGRIQLHACDIDFQRELLAILVEARGFAIATQSLSGFSVALQIVHGAGKLRNERLDGLADQLRLGISEYSSDSRIGILDDAVRVYRNDAFLYVMQNCLQAHLVLPQGILQCLQTRDDVPEEPCLIPAYHLAHADMACGNIGQALIMGHVEDDTIT